MPYFQKDEYPELPEDTPLLCEITEVEITKSRAYGSDEMRDQIAFRFEVVAGEFAGAKIRGWANAVFSPRSTLAKIATAALDNDALESFDTEHLVGRQLFVVGDYGEDGKSTFLRPRRFKAARKPEVNEHSRPPTQRPSDSVSEPRPERVAVASGASSDGIDF